ncbi:hypothetical protein RU10_01870 [Pseudomonas fluorescens]|uniref:Uncharacterized protein n=1 Tax=Pseudomonas fluorescens TaxID=294 RepID=A0AAE2DYV3_PSEFL|nr:hypothetical protein RU10_01870 [Pseudomonas fluorescens]
MPGAGAAARIEDLVLFIICQKFEKGGDDSIVRAMMASGLSQYLEMFLLGGGRPRCLVLYIDLEDLSDYGFCWASAMLDSERYVQVGVSLEYPRIGSLSLGRGLG